jgi:hypothetical protein
MVVFFAWKKERIIELWQIKECGETSEKLRVCMDEVYAYHNAKLSR